VPKSATLILREIFSEIFHSLDSTNEFEDETGSPPAVPGISASLDDPSAFNALACDHTPKHQPSSSPYRADRHGRERKWSQFVAT